MCCNPYFFSKGVVYFNQWTGDPQVFAGWNTQQKGSFNFFYQWQWFLKAKMVGTHCDGSWKYFGKVISVNFESDFLGNGS